jgi:predicted dehydrogenase
MSDRPASLAGLTATASPSEATAAGSSSMNPRRPRLGFLGVGWIGRHRLEALAASGAGEIVAVSDPAREMAEAARAVAPGAEAVDSLTSLLDAGIDGLVIATPSALHAEQSIAALERGVAVFCQKPLGRTAAETHRVIETARHNDLLLGVDLSYRFAEAFRAVREVVRAGEIGEVFAADLVFHNAYGPDKPWFFDPALSGGGCVMDLGIHLVDQLFWVLGSRGAASVSSRLFAGGRPLEDTTRVEDFATARIDLKDGATAQLACSWNLPAGREAIISATFYGTAGGATVRNVNGSFYDFIAERFHGTRTEALVEPPDAWGGRAAVAWAEALAGGARFDATAAEETLAVARVLDAIYGRSQGGTG